MFQRGKVLIGMVHVGALPGAPFSRRAVAELATAAADEASVLQETGFDGLIIENMHDRPYVHGEHGPEIVAAMTRIACAVRERVRLPMGVQILSGGEREALAVAHACGGAFVRCENFVFAHVADEGLLGRAAAGPLLRYRRAIGAEQIKIIADIQKKHAAHAITADLTLTDLAHTAELFGADGVIVTGAFTGAPAHPPDVVEARRACKLPVWVGSGVTPEQVAPLLTHADALIVGTWIKSGGHWEGPVDRARCLQLVAAAGAR